jgi:hypothetical protein
MLTQRHCDTHDYPSLKQTAEAAEARSEAAAERYHDSIKTMTRLLEDKREAKPRKKFLGFF